MVEQIKDTGVKLKRLFIESSLPEPLAPLMELANNLWWSWNKDAIDLFKRIDADALEAADFNPIAMLDQLSRSQTKALVEDTDFMGHLHRVHAAFHHYLAEPGDPASPRIAYFSMEFGLHISVRLYSGGLGVLAGDYLKEASDQNANMAGVGLLYRYGYFQQSVTLHGDQINDYPSQEYTKLPMKPVRDDSGEWVRITVDIQGRPVIAKIWKLEVGRIPLYLLDTDINENTWEDRGLTHQLYGGDNEHRLSQEILLGIGGIRALSAIGYPADIYHCNEGHAAFMGLERVRQLVHQKQLNFDEAREVVRATSLFTTHTPVPAGHDYFSEGLLSRYLYNYVSELGIDWSRFIALGRVDPDDSSEPFSMSHLAIRMSQEVNGVSKLHGAVSQKMFKVLYPGYHADELHIGYVTNGVHYPTWIAREWHAILREQAGGESFIHHQSEPDFWNRVNDLPSEQFVAIRKALKQRLITYIRTSLRKNMTRRGDKPSQIFETLNGIREDALIIGFARRFATYKRAHLLFNNPERLADIINNQQQPVMFLFAGKAHPADKPGQQLIKHIIEISHRPEFAGKVIFLEGYNMEMAKYLVQGVDIWLNTPTRPKEASGTSGMKAAMNGVVNLSVLDGWWAEGYRPDSGWALPLERTYADQDLQDELDAETIYNLLEFEIIPTFFEHNDQGFSERWVAFMKNIMTKVGPQFTMKRMLDDYYERFYSPLARRGKLFLENNHTMARDIVAWKNLMTKKWDDIRIVEKDVFDTDNFSLSLGEQMKVRIKLYIGDIPAEQLGLEAVYFRRIDDDTLDLISREDIPVVESDHQTVTFAKDIDLITAGVFEYGFRLSPRHPMLPHKQDLALIKWL